MVSTFHGIELGKQGLVAHQVALNTTGQNLANVSNPNYSRQKVNLEAGLPIYDPALNRENTAGQIGTGVHVQKIIRVRDQFIDNRIIDEKGYVGYWKEKDFHLRQIEAIHNEPGTPSLKTSLEEFTKSWNRLANYPNEGGAREALRSNAIELTGTIKSKFDHLMTLRTNVNDKINAKVDEANNLIRQIASYNKQIARVEGMSDSPNDLLDKRDALLDQLADIIDIRISREDNNELFVYIGAEILIQGDKFESLKTVEDVNNEGLYKVVWSNGETTPQIQKGELGGLLEVRDVHIKNQIDQLDNFAVNLIETVNEIHRDGFGLNFNTQTNFFTHRDIHNSSITGDFDRNGDGIYDATGIYKISGTREVKSEDVIGSNGTINLGPDRLNGNDVIINYTATDTVGTVVEKINRSNADVVAYLNQKGNLTIKATRAEDPNFKNFVIRHLEDSGTFLTGFTGILNQSGAAGSFDWNRTGEVTKLNNLEYHYTKSPYDHAAGWISVDEAIMKEVNNIAAARGIDTDGNGIANKITGENDGSNALRIVAALTSENEHNNLDVLKNIDQDAIMMDKHSKSFRSYLDNMVENLGTETRVANTEYQKESAIIHNLYNMRESISGVNIDEEMSALVTYQHGYNASARFVTFIDRMLDTLINRMGV